MANLQQLEERKEELVNELSTYMWWGNEDDADYKEEYGIEYEHLQTELDGIREQIYQLKNKQMANSNQFSKLELLAFLKERLEVRSENQYSSKCEYYYFNEGAKHVFQSIITSIEDGRFNQQFSNNQK